jgi:soluble lytic murein transglycosylase-like protein
MRWWWLLAAAEAWAQGADPVRAAMEKQRAAAEIQRESARKQALAAGARLPAWTAPAPGAAAAPACERMDPAALDALLENAASAHGVETSLLRAVLEQESGGYSCAVSSRGALGLMQLMPSTAAELGVADAFDPRENIDAGARYLKRQLERYQGDVFRGLSAYNAGPGAVEEAGGIPDFAETRNFVSAILRKIAGPTGAAGPVPDP